MVELDRATLAEEFGLDPELFQFNPDNSEINSESADLRFDRTTEKILRDNIERAETLMSKIEHEIDHGNFTARMVEAASLVINGITSTVKEIQTKEYNEKYMKLREKLANLKHYEIEVKRIKNERKQQPTNQNIIITDRETLLKSLSEQKKIENKE